MLIDALSNVAAMPGGDAAFVAERRDRPADFVQLGAAKVYVAVNGPPRLLGSARGESVRPFGSRYPHKRESPN
jgi:hypothetical protein